MWLRLEIGNNSVLQSCEGLSRPALELVAVGTFQNAPNERRNQQKTGPNIAKQNEADQ
jgi:hypothetical protein